VPGGTIVIMNDTEKALAAIPARMNEAWDRGDGAGFAADFTEDAEFVAFDGTVLSGHAAIVAFHQPLFDTVLKGTRLVNSEVVFAREVRPGIAVLHQRLGVVMQGETEPLPSRNSMQLFVLVHQEGRWQVVASQNSRIVTLEYQQKLDEVSWA
jgi:uncharacterized protein (TIGR02246 family)